ncbi:MAG: carbohydrate binding family 9 domain-containing protein [Melioribacteraceae bacterium]
MSIRVISKILFLSIIFLYSSAFAQAESKSPKPVMQAFRLDKSFEINGKLDNPIWLNANPIEINYEVTPGENTPAPQKTIVRALYDDKYIYFGFQCFDTNPEQIRANISERDKMYQDDWVFVGIDTYGDYQRSYEFCVNPFGIQGDLGAILNGEDSSLDWIWFAKAERNDKGWTAEMAIPFSSLSFPNSDVQNWRINILRTIPRASRTQLSWVPLDRNIPGIMSQAGYLEGLKNIHQGSSIEILPYAMGQEQGKLSDMNNPGSGIKFDSFQSRIGGGIKYSPTPDFSLDAVINPDFSQIESDAAQISVNTTFALSYPEKRPFFLIGRELLISSMYYSRSINDPLAAARINGKSGSLSYIFMTAYDRNTVFVIPGEEGSNTVGTHIKSLANIGRLRYDIGDESYIGSQIMTRDLSGGHNYVFGVDWNYKFWSNWYFSGEGFLSQTKELNDLNILNSTRQFGRTDFNAAFNGEEYWGNGFHLNLSHSERNYNFNLTFNNFSPTYQTYNGLFDQNGYRQFYMGHEYAFYPTGSFIDFGSLGFNSYQRYDFYGIKKEQVIQPYFSFTLKGQTNLYASYLLVNDESFLGTWFYGIHRSSISINSRPINAITLFASGSFGKFIYRSSSPEIGSGHNLNATLTLKPTSQLNVSLSYARARLSSEATKELFYDGNIYRAVAVYQFTPEFFFRTIIQYDSFAKAYQVYPLFSYKLSAFTTFYAGATSDYLNYEGIYGVTNTNQQYFVKIQYLFGM